MNTQAHDMERLRAENAELRTKVQQQARQIEVLKSQIHEHMNRVVMWQREAKGLRKRLGLRP